MIKVLPVFLVLAAIWISGWGTTTRLGKIIDEAGNPVPGAVVSDGQNQVFSANDGTFYFYTSADSLIVQRLGYLPRRVAFSNMIKPIVLKAEPIVLPKVIVSETALDLFSAAPDRISLPIDPDRHYYSAGEILSSAPSIHSNDVLLKGESQSVSILGNLARHSLIVLDGIPLNPDGGSFDLSLLEADNIASIELIRNNASVYGGASAIGGIVQITSKQGSTRSGERFLLGTELGSFGYAKNSFSFETAQSDWNLRFSASNLNTDNDFPYRVREWWTADSLAVRANNAKRQNSLSASYSRRFDELRFSLQSDLSSFHRQLPGTVNFADVYLNAWLEGFANRNRLALDAPFGGLETRLLLWLNLDGTLYDNTRAPLPVFVSKYRQKLANLGLRLSLGRETHLFKSLKWNSGLAAEAGTEHYQNLDLLMPDKDLDHYSRFANASLKNSLVLDLGDLIWTNSAALRHDHADLEDNLSWRLESGLRHIGFVETILGATLGTSFSLPSPYDLYWKGDSQALGNPDLASETSRGWQLWLENRLGAFSLRTSYHHNDIDNLIQWRQIQMFGNVWKPLNIGRARIRNLEVEAGLTPWEWLSFSSSALYTQALDLSSLPADSAPRLMYTPELNYSLRLELNWANFNFWSRYAFTGEQFTTPDNLADPLPSYSLLDLGFSFPLSVMDWKITPHFSMRNLLNASYEVYAYVPQPGISFYGGLSLQFSD
ncbi:MAG: TonB-dependent receptor [Candidatus Syntrophosphaera sp.]|nr:TonB-dependent receptor [Candidatus Syntrophosphaera sp.]